MADTLRGASGEPLVRSTFISSAAPLPRDVPDLVAATPAGLMAATQEYGQFSGWHWTKAGIVTRCVHLLLITCLHTCNMHLPCVSYILQQGQGWGIGDTGPVFWYGSHMAVVVDLSRSLPDVRQDVVVAAAGFIVRGKYEVVLLTWGNSSTHDIAK